MYDSRSNRTNYINNGKNTMFSLPRTQWRFASHEINYEYYHDQKHLHVVHLVQLLISFDGKL